MPPFARIISFTGPATATPGQALRFSATVLNDGDEPGYCGVEMAWWHGSEAQYRWVGDLWLSPGETHTAALFALMPGIATHFACRGYHWSDAAWSWIEDHLAPYVRVAIAVEEVPPTPTPPQGPSGPWAIPDWLRAFILFIPQGQAILAVIDNMSVVGNNVSAGLGQMAQTLEAVRVLANQAWAGITTWLNEKDPWFGQKYGEWAVGTLATLRGEIKTEVEILAGMFGQGDNAVREYADQQDASWFDKAADSLNFMQHVLGNDIGELRDRLNTIIDLINDVPLDAIKGFGLNPVAWLMALIEKILDAITNWLLEEVEPER